MAIDVLTVNRIRTSDSANARSNLDIISAASTNVSISACYSNLHNNVDYWDTYFPAAPTGGTVLCVGCMQVGIDTFLRCGASCVWTVPAGVTVAKFEVWGPGAGTLPGCCCSIQPFGAAGAYSTICIPVVAGTSYTLTAGCALCCYACQSIAGRNSGTSSVTGGILTNFCAPGAPSCFPWIRMARSYRGFACQLDCNMFNIAIDRCLNTDAYCGIGQAAYMYGVCICTYGESCVSPNTCTNATVPSLPWIESCSGYGHAVLTTGEIRKAMGVPVRYPEFCITGGSLCGYVKHPPIPGFVSTSQCCVSWTSTQATFGGYLCSPLQGSNYLTAPSSGGNMVYTVQGCNSNCGDSGRGGMVRVTYC